MAIELFDLLGVGAMRLGSPAAVAFPADDGIGNGLPLPLDETPEQHGGLTCDQANASITIGQSGAYRLAVGLNGRYTGELSIYLLLNGVRVDPDNPLALQGRGGTRPVAIYWSNILQVTAGDVVQVVVCGDGGDVAATVAHAHFSATRVG